MFPAVVLLGFAASSVGQWTLNDGTQMSFVFVSPSAKQAWRANGEIVPYASLPKPSAPVWSSKETEPVLVTYMNSRKTLAGAPIVRFKLPASEESNSTFNVPCWDKNVRVAGFKPLDHQPAMEDIAVGVAGGGWSVLSWVEFVRAGHGVHAVKVHGARLRLTVAGSGGHQAGPYVYVNVPQNPEYGNVFTRFVVKSKNGREMPFLGATPMQPVKGVTTYQYQGDVEDVYQVILQARKFEWHTIRVAHFKPNSS